MKKLLSVLLVILMMFAITSCEASEPSSTGIYGLNIESFSKKTVMVDETSDEYEVDILSTQDEFATSDINVVIDDPSIIDISYSVKEGFFDSYIGFNIIGLKEGTTSFYFETIDGIEKSDAVEITVEPYKTSVTSISFNETDKIVLWPDDEIIGVETIYFSYESDETIDIEEEFEFVVENPKIATFEYDTDSWFDDSCTITALKPGKTRIYIQTKDGTVKSKKRKIVVKKEEEEEEIVYTTEADNSRTVYITPYGEKYHFSVACAGDNASATTENAVKYSHDPCKKCAY